MQELIKVIENLKRSKIKNLVKSRTRQFKNIRKKTNNKIFSELCFCLITANFNAERAIRIQNQIKEGFCYLPKNKLVYLLKNLGYRFPNKRTEYITEARKHKNFIKNIIEDFGTENELREWLVKNVKGLGYKEASHFLRNIGFTDLAIIDFHIIDILTRYKLIKKPKTLTERKYLEIENVLRKIANKLKLNLAELDLYLWYIETGKILK